MTDTLSLIGIFEKYLQGALARRQHALFEMSEADKRVVTAQADCWETAIEETKKHFVAIDTPPNGIRAAAKELRERWPLDWCTDEDAEECVRLVLNTVGQHHYTHIRYRETFEQWAEKHYPSVLEKYPSGDYVDIRVRAASIAWQAALNATKPAARDTISDYHRGFNDGIRGCTAAADALSAITHGKRGELCKYAEDHQRWTKALAGGDALAEQLFALVDQVERRVNEECGGDTGVRDIVRFTLDAIAASEQARQS